MRLLSILISSASGGSLARSAAAPVMGMAVLLSLGSLTSCSKAPEVTAVPQQSTSKDNVASAGADLASAGDSRQESFLTRVRSVQGHHLMTDKKEDEKAPGGRSKNILH